MTRCEQQDSLLQERRETLCSLEADHDQVGPVELCELGGESAVNGCTPSLGGKKTLGPLVVARIPSVIGPMCVVKSVSVMACMGEMAGVKETPCVTETACVRERYESEMAVGMRENETATACPSVMTRCISIVTCRSAWVAWRQRRRQTRDKGRVAAVAVLGTVPDWHSSAHEVRAMLRTRPPRARLRE